MDSNVQPSNWNRYLKICAWLGYQPEATVDTNLQQRYKTLYTRYCQDNGLHLNSDVDIQKLSEILYIDLCGELGYESTIQIRRNISTLTDHVRHQIHSDKGYLFYCLGSRAEGFGTTISDVDHMLVHTDYVVVNNTTEISEVSRAKSNKAVITMETQHTKPGYVRLILETDKSTTRERISSSCHNYDDKLYISSTNFREHIMSSLRKNAEIHGPCTTTIHGHRVHDMAECLSCTSQPTAVQNWVIRCNKYNWPDSVVLEHCLSLGCHLAPVGSMESPGCHLAPVGSMESPGCQLAPVGSMESPGCQLVPVGSMESPQEDLEWRISFTLMEKTILHSLSHSQFICYGLLKMYLKEVLCSFEEIKDLISSYFMKTVLLWEIQTNSQHNVGADSLFQVFRNCLQRLFTWVKTEYCPNFFIPENNMFENRIYGESKHTLQNILELLFKDKFYGLYRCKSVDLPYLIFQVLINEKRSIVVSVDESRYVTDEDIETDVWLEINTQFHAFLYKQSSIADFNTLLRTLDLILTKDSLTHLEKRAVQTWISEVAIYITTHNFKDIIAPNVSPDTVLKKYNLCCNIFHTLDHKGSVAPLYLATLMYITGRYQSCLHVITECNKRLKEGFLQVVYVSVNLQLTILRLELELQIDLLSIERAFLHIDPRLYVSMLSVLCHHNLGDVVRARTEFQRISELRMPYRKLLYLQEISFQVLGICCEIIGKYEGAYISYVEAYNSPRVSLHGNAPLLRILCLIFKLLQK